MHAPADPRMHRLSRLHLTRADVAAMVGLEAELDKIEDIIKDKQAKIRYAKKAIMENDSTIERLLSQVVRA